MMVNETKAKARVRVMREVGKEKYGRKRDRFCCLFIGTNYNLQHRRRKETRKGTFPEATERKKTENKALTQY